MTRLQIVRCVGAGDFLHNRKLIGPGACGEAAQLPELSAAGSTLAKLFVRQRLTNVALEPAGRARSPGEFIGQAQGDFHLTGVIVAAGS